MAPARETEYLKQIIDHVFLPPALPGSDEGSLWLSALTECLLSALQDFQGCYDGALHDRVANAIHAVANYDRSHLNHGDIHKERLQAILTGLQTPDNVIPVHIAAQNGGLLVCSTDHSIVFEAFRLSPPNKAVYRTAGRLRRYFPEAAVEISLEKFHQPDFQESIPQMLSTMSTQPVSEMQTKVSKSGKLENEECDTTSSAVVTHLFFAILQSVGATPAQTPGQWKNTKEEVIWGNSELPWRRSAVWLLLRIALRRALFCSSTPGQLLDDGLYKRFMVFFMSKLLRKASEAQFSSSTLSVMSTKIAQRLIKLDSPEGEPWALDVRDIISQTTAMLETRWQKVIYSNSPRLTIPSLSATDVCSSLTTEITCLDEYLARISQRGNAPATVFRPPQPDMPSYSPNTLPSFPSMSFSGESAQSLGYCLYRLSLIEKWIEQHLDTWVEAHSFYDQACADIGRLLRGYTHAGSLLYQGQPSGSSTMYLTTVELWIACDRCAVRDHPLLGEYAHQIPEQVWGSLVLSKSSDMKRLFKAENYLHSRNRNSSSKSHILSSYGTVDAFAVRYFAASQPHQDLLERIEQKATEARNAKRQELRTLQDRHRDLMRFHDSMEHTMIMMEDSWGDRRVQHSGRCQRCALLEEANDLTIQPHEWPLPSDPSEAQNVVFELWVPPQFAAWRDNTLFLLRDVLHFELQRAEPSYSLLLEQYSELRQCFGQISTRGEMCLLSDVKPDSSTHRIDRPINLIKDVDICLATGPRWKYFHRDVFLGAFQPSFYVSNACTLELPRRSAALQDFLQRTWADWDGVETNYGIAKQHLCPTAFSAAEFKALTSMPYGQHLVWHNILIQLAMPSVNLNKTETLIFICQLADQCGPGGDTWRRSSHRWLDDSNSYLEKCLGRLEEGLARVKENWEMSNALCIVLELAVRLLSVTSDMRCLRFLAKCRQITCQWQFSLRQKAFTTQQEDTRLDFARRANDAALLTLLSFDVSEEHMDGLLSNHSAIRMYLECLITMQQTVYSQQAEPSELHRLFNLRCRQTINHWHLPLQNALTGDATGLDSAIRANWDAFQRWNSTPWDAVSFWWLHTIVSPGSVEPEGVDVHFNLVTGELLVQGHPRGRLPADYEYHSTFKLLFGQMAMEAMPHRINGMAFSASTRFRGYDLFFGLDDSTCDLVVQAVEGAIKWELLPSHLLRYVVPSRFLEDYVYWYSASEHIIVVRSKANPWTRTGTHWTLTKADGKWAMRHDDGGQLVFFGSAVSKLWSPVFAPLEETLGLTIIFREDSATTDISIPRLGLDFFVRDGSTDVYSRQYLGKTIDVDQSMGTLIGLRNKLILCPSQPAGSRMVLIPYGIPSASGQGPEDPTNHPVISIAHTATSFQVYNINEHLGQLVGSGGLLSLLYLAELHAMTSSCLPDYFTGHTGSAEALLILRSASLRSLEFTKDEEGLALQRIAALSPVRQLYPEKRREMQEVYWHSSLPFTSQLDDFLLEAVKICEQAEKWSVFHQPPKTVKLEVPSIALHHRGSLRSLSYPVYLRSKEVYHVDSVYEMASKARENLIWRSTLAIRFGTAMHSGQSILATTGQPFNASFFYDFLQRDGLDEAVFGVDAIVSLVYDASLMNPPKSSIAPSWCKLHRLLSDKHRPRSPINEAAWLASLAFAPEANVSTLQALVAFSRIPEMTRIAELAPILVSQDLKQGYEYKSSQIVEIARLRKIGFSKSSEAQLPKLEYESNRDLDSRRREAFNTAVSNEILFLDREFRKQWPCPTPSLSGITLQYLRDTAILKAAGARFTLWYWNLTLWRYLEEVCTALNQSHTREIQIAAPILTQAEYNPRKEAKELLLADLLPRFQPRSIDPAWTKQLPHPVIGRKDHVTDSSKVEALSRALRGRGNTQQETHYLDKLDESIAQLKHNNVCILERTSEQMWSEIIQLERESVARYNSIRSDLSHTLGRTEVSTAIHKTAAWEIAALTLVWPRTSIRGLLALLSHCQWKRVPPQWKRVLVAFAISITDKQAAQRFQAAASNPHDLSKELESAQPRTWDPMQFPDSLLLEIEGNLRIREVQAEIAANMRDPPDAKNSAMQLNMGEGKSFVIVPIVAAALANGSKLVRVLVAKPQSRQMFDIITTRLGGLVDRKVYMMPMSRMVALSSGQVEELIRLYKTCMETGGVLLIQPEHALSLKLRCVDTAIQKSDAASQLWELNDFFHNNSRDIVDESDENFSPRFELVYTIGSQRDVEHSPERWIVIQEVLGSIVMFTRILRQKYPQGIEIDDHGRASFPPIRFLSKRASNDLVQHLATHICQNGMYGIPLSHESKNLRDALLRYFVDHKPEARVLDQVMSSSVWTSVSANLQLLRGLFAGGILDFIFRQKRWRVNYGLDDTRVPPTRLAVPYRAKDNPSPRSEFSHPDTIIGLTCLSYYYRGLSDQDLTLSLEHLLRSDQADLEYRRWVGSSTDLPASFQHLKSINLQDKTQCTVQVFPHLRYSKGAVDYFLCHIVFNKEMQEFPFKLTASGWDTGCEKQHPLTGFSGTNDARHVLPTSVTQIDQHRQEHTNALVLDYVMRPENTVVSMSDEGLGGVCRGRSLLDLATRMDQEIRVILDVGAQILDMTNEEFAGEWLKATVGREDVEAVVYCDADDRICVVNRHKETKLVKLSPYAENLSRCLVFLDEAHTRGIDLRLPSHYRAAVSLGAGLTKDRLIQACMRMRKLAHGQSLAFFVPEEIETKIREATGIPDHQCMSTCNVLEWAIRGTWADLEYLMSSWYTQGKLYAKQKLFWDEARTEGGREFTEIAKELHEDDAPTLKSRYHPRGDALAIEPEVGDARILAQIAERVERYGGVFLDGKALQEEQERELSPEIEQERQIERPAPATPAIHHLHPDVRMLVETGKAVRSTRDGTQAFVPAFRVFEKTTAVKLLELSRFPGHLLATKDFERTIYGSSDADETMDLYQRPVQWVLTTCASDGDAEIMVVLSPYEANQLMREIEISTVVTLHLFAPQRNWAYKPLDKLSLYTVGREQGSVVPPSLRVELILFSGQLYFDSYVQYVQVCTFLCLAHKAAPNGRPVGADGFILPNGHSEERDTSTIFQESPVKFLKALMTRIVNNCEGVEKTHVGRMLDGILLKQDDFEGEAEDR